MDEIAAAIKRIDTSIISEQKNTEEENEKQEIEVVFNPLSDDRSIEALNLSVRSFNCLKRSKI